MLCQGAQDAPEPGQQKEKTEGGILFKKLVKEVEKPEKQDWPENS